MNALIKDINTMKLQIRDLKVAYDQLIRESKGLDKAAIKAKPPKPLNYDFFANQLDKIIGPELAKVSAKVDSSNTTCNRVNLFITDRLITCIRLINTEGRMSMNLPVELEIDFPVSASTGNVLLQRSGNGLYHYLSGEILLINPPTVSPAEKPDIVQETELDWTM